ncbi:hypothetical protein LXL04_035443 [Taraxacum kok-saghyz]
MQEMQLHIIPDPHEFPTRLKVRSPIYRPSSSSKDFDSHQTVDSGKSLPLPTDPHEFPTRLKVRSPIYRPSSSSKDFDSHQTVDSGKSLPLPTGNFPLKL